MLEFDPRQLNRPERDAWTEFSELAGPEGAAAMFTIMVQWVATLSRQGKSPGEVREKVIGTFYDNVTLMNRGQVMRYRTIGLAKAMVEQALEALAHQDAVEADASAPLRIQGE